MTDGTILDVYTDMEIKAGRVDQGLSYITIVKRNWTDIKEKIDRKLDDEWDYEDEVQEASCEAALKILNDLERILKGDQSGSG